MYHQIIKWSLFFLSFFLIDSYAVSSQDTHESFVWLRITKNRGNNFYRVLVDEKETPYINLQEILTSYLDFSKYKCDQQRKFCDVTLPSKENLHVWIDFKEKQCGSYEDKKTNVLLDDDLLIAEDIFWVKYDVLTRCFPVEAKWDLKLYYLSIIPSYTLVEDQLSARERSRSYNILAQKKKDEIAKVDPLTPKDKYRTHGKYNLVYLDAPSEKQANKKFNYDLISDIGGGTLKVGGGVETGSKFNPANYKTYSLRDKKYFKSLDIGNVFYNGESGLLPDIIGTNGIRLESKEREHGASISSRIENQSLPGTDVELYRNGVFLGSMIVPANGIYKFENIYASGGDSLLLRFYYSDGSTSEEIIKVADDGALLLANHESEVRVFSGELRDGRFSLLNYRYGIFEKASAGLQLGMISSLSDEAGNNKSKREKPFVITDVVTLPFKTFNVTGEALVSEKEIDYLARMNFTFLEPNIFNFQFKHIEGTSPLLSFQNNLEGDSWKITHGLNIWRFQITDFYQETENTRTTSLNVTSFVTSNANVFAEATRDVVLNQSRTEQIKGGFNLRLNDFSNLQMYRLWLPPVRSNNVELNVHGGIDIPWNAKLIYNKSDLDKGNYSAELSYTLSKRLTFEILAANDKFGFQISLSDVISQGPGPVYNEDFATGTVSGRLVSPVDQKGNYYPIADAIITVDGRSTKTNSEGYFELSGISPYRNVEFKVDPMGMDVSLAPKKENEVMYFRPGTHIEYNPEIVNTVGMDGVVILPKGVNIMPSLLIDVKNSKGAILQSINVESDGFFVIEGLAPGEYDLELVDLSKNIKTQSKKIRVEQSEEWIRNFRWELN